METKPKYKILQDMSGGGGREVKPQGWKGLERELG